MTSANVACGFHAGDPPILRATTALAAARGVAVGAQVSYRDLAGFGRRFLDITASELADDVVYVEDVEGHIGAYRLSSP